jgi:hypothetical protein
MATYEIHVATEAGYSVMFFHSSIRRCNGPISDCVRMYLSGAEYCFCEFHDTLC